MADFIDAYGMVNSRPDEINAESSLLWSVENYMLERPQVSKETLERAINACRTAPGIFDQNPSHLMVGDDRYMSHDQLTAIMAFCYKNDLSITQEIWSKIKEQAFCYDNVDPDYPSWKRILHPRDIIYYAYLNKSLIGYIFLPILFIIMLVSCCFSSDTTGKLLSWVRCQGCMDKSFIWKMFYKSITYIITKRFGGWGQVFNIYFYYPGHPNRWNI